MAGSRQKVKNVRMRDNADICAFPFSGADFCISVDIWCGIRSLITLIGSDIAKHGLRPAAGASIKLIVDVPQGFAFRVLEAAKPTCEQNLHFVALTFSACAEYWEDLWDLQPAGLLVTTDHDLDLARTVQRVATGEKSRITPSRASVLNQAERLLLRSVARGYSNKTIARQLGLQEKTVMNSLTTIYQKLNLNSRTQAILHYWSLQPNSCDALDSAAHLAWPSPGLRGQGALEAWDIYPTNTGYSSLISD